MARNRPQASSSLRAGRSTEPQVYSVDQAIDLAYRHWQAGQAEQAAWLCQEIVAAAPGQPDTLHLMGLMAHAEGRLDEAIGHLKQACAHPTVPASYLSNLGELSRRRGLFDQAEQATRRSLAKDGSLFGTWSNLGIILQEAGKPEESIIGLQTAVALAPDFAEGHNNLANSLRLLGRMHEAAAGYSRALALKADYLDATVNLGTLLGEMGRGDDGLALLRQAIGLEPRAAKAYLGAAALELGRGRGLEALEWLEGLRDFSPGHPGLALQRSRAFRYIGRHLEALEAADAALADAPDHGEAMQARGLALQALGRPDEALEMFTEVAQSNTLLAEGALVAKGTLLASLGRHDGARHALTEARRNHPRSAAAWYSGLDHVPFADGDCDALEALLASPAGASLRDRIMLRFVLGTAWADADNGERAFRHFAEGNRLMRQTLAYDADAVDRALAEIAAAFPATRFEQQPAAPSADPSELPLFIIGLPCAGGGLVERVLASHPNVRGGRGGVPVAPRLLEGIVYLAGRPASVLSQMWADGAGELAARGDRYLKTAREGVGDARRLVHRSPVTFLYAALIARMLPGARFIHVRRDPVDCASAIYTRLFMEPVPYAYDMTELGRFHRSHEALVAHWRTLLPAERWLDLCIEDFLAGPDPQIRRLLDFSGLSWNRACLEFPINIRSAGRGRQLASHLGPLAASLHKGDAA